MSLLLLCTGCVEKKFNLLGEASITIQARSEYVEPGYFFEGNTDVSIENHLNVNEPGTYTITYSAKTGVKVKTLTRTIIVVDTASPEPSLRLKGPSTVTMDKGGTYYEYGVNISDNCGDVRKSLKITHDIDTSTVGHYKITYSVSDASGNSTSISRNVIVAEMPRTTIYLTFDDGPFSDTISILNTLKNYGIKATFFIMYRGEVSGPVILREVQEGHAIGVHSWSHNYQSIYASEDAFYKDLNAISGYIYKLTGIRSMLYRFPGGSSNTVSWFNRGIMTTLTQSVLNKGYHYFDWNVSSGDESPGISETSIFNNVINGIQIGTSNYVLMHDGPHHKNTALALPQILDYLKSINAVYLPMSMDTPQYHHKVTN